MENVLKFLDSILQLEEGLRGFLRDKLKPSCPLKNTYLIKEGDIARNIGFIERGVIRAFRTTKKGKEKTNYFVREGDVFVSIRSFFTQKTAIETLQTIEPCVIYYLSYELLQEAFAKWPYFHYHRAELLQKYYLLSEEREHMRQQEHKIDRMRFLMTHYRDLVGRVPDYLLASFIDTTPEYFCALKSRYLRGH